MELEEHFDRVDANNQQRLEEERRLAEFKRRVTAAREMLDRSAVMLQKIFRGRKARADLKASHGKKKKKGGGKKKKK